MKCQHCGTSEATIYYKSTVNGRTTEVHVCPHCAGELGYDRALHDLERRSRRMFRQPFSLLRDPFFDGFASHLLTEFPAPGNTLEEAKTAQKDEGILSDAESRTFDLQRQRNALQHALQDAIAAENYEEAARLRDEIRTLPNE